METTIKNHVEERYAAILPCAISANLLEVRAAAAREVSVARAVIGTWNDVTTGMKCAFAPAHVKGSPAWSPPL